MKEQRTKTGPAPSSLESAEWKQKRNHEAELHGAFLGL
jgi:hypothetical protein